MDYKLITYGGGGIFSLLMDIIIPRVYDIEADRFNIEVRENQYNPPANCFDFVFEQPDIQEPVIECFYSRNRGGFRKKGICMGAIEDFNELDLLKECCKKFIIRKEITDRLFELPADTLGVHFRGGDMDRKHPQYGIFKYGDYRKRIARLKPKSIYIASDNYEVIARLKHDFKIPIHYFDSFIRDDSVRDDTYKTQMDNSSTEVYWQEAFIDMLMLSRCDTLLCRVSSLANASIAFAENIKVVRL